MLESAVYDLLNPLIRCLKSEPDEAELLRSATVFAPHPDDETLGCGGTIIRKVRAGAEVKLVVMTDGRNSHRSHIDPDKLKVIRTYELMNAAKVLGIAQKNITLLEFEDGKLSAFRKEAEQKISEIILQDQPKQIFIPYSREVTDDHSITNEVVSSILKMCQTCFTVYEYPVWFWCHWPWVSKAKRIRKKILLKNTFSAWLGLRLLKDFNYRVHIADVREIKRSALDKYESQMTRRHNSPKWAVLGDIGDGQFLNCFFKEWEIFKRYNVGIK